MYIMYAVIHKVGLDVILIIFGSPGVYAGGLEFLVLAHDTTTDVYAGGLEFLGLLCSSV